MQKANPSYRKILPSGPLPLARWWDNPCSEDKATELNKKKRKLQNSKIQAAEDKQKIKEAKERVLSANFIMPSPYTGRTQSCHICPGLTRKKARSQYACCLCKLPACLKNHLFTLCSICYEAKKSLIYDDDPFQQ